MVVYAITFHVFNDHWSSDMLFFDVSQLCNFTLNLLLCNAQIISFFFSSFHTALKKLFFFFFYFQLTKNLRNWTTSMNESLERGRPNPCRMCSMRVKIRSRSGTVMITDGTQIHCPRYAARVTPEPLQLSAHTGESFISSPNSSCWDSLCFLNRRHRCQYCCASLGSHCCFT